VAGFNSTPLAGFESTADMALRISRGRRLRVPGMALEPQADPQNQQFGDADGSAGLAGESFESDHWASARALLAL
jgi:hypothetical protein